MRQQLQTSFAFNSQILSILRGYLGDITSLKVRKATRDRLAKFGNKSETFDQVINRLMDSYEKNSKQRNKDRT
jgi:hypothetical protein